MNPALLVTLAAVAAVVVAGLVMTLATVAAGRRRLQADLRASREDLATVRSRLDALSDALEGASTLPDESQPPQQQYVITSLQGGTRPGGLVVAEQDPSGSLASASGRHFASVAAAESVVRVVSLAHGVRHALRAENRNRIRFEMQREVKRARRQRRRDLKEAKRHLRTQHPSGQRPEQTENAA